MIQNPIDQSQDALMAIAMLFVLVPLPLFLLVPGCGAQINPPQQHNHVPEANHLADSAWPAREEPLGRSANVEE